VHRSMGERASQQSACLSCQARRVKELGIAAGLYGLLAVVALATRTMGELAYVLGCAIVVVSFVAACSYGGR
jgi:hypothetical protein